MKLADLKFLLPRMKYSKHTPKALSIPEGHFMEKRALEGMKPKTLERTPAKDEVIKQNVSEPIDRLFAGM